MTLDDLLAKWLGREGGAERANYQMFLSEFTRAMGLPEPEPKGRGLGEYEFEAPVRSEAALGRKGTGRIDLYKRDCFILEAKQSQLRSGEEAPPEPAPPPPETLYDLFGHAIGVAATSARTVPRYDRLMADARLQAERYALALPGDRRAPPFLIVADIGRSFELFFDWAGNGRGYAPFPDERRYRVPLADLRDPAIAALFLGIWTDPASVDPRLKAAAVTRDIAVRLSRVAEALEKDQRDLRPGDRLVSLGIEATSLFLMRMLFCMFAEDVGLLPTDSFKSFLREAVEKSSLFWRHGLADLWSRMNDPDEANRFWSAGDAIVRYFNGNLFFDTQIFDLPSEFKRELLVAAGQDWRAVEPAIFGTLLEQVLTAKDRARLGAHYTPRAYVDRLIEATMMDVLRPEWDAVLKAARAKADAGDTAGAIADACAWHKRLTAIAVLDPACGTGNFLYVAMEQVLRLEGAVRQFVVALGGVLEPAVHPNQFLGLELNPRAAVIAELVLWIGWLRYRLANTPEAIGTPVLPTLTNINMGTHGGYDAVLARDELGEPDTANPRRPVWPEADFIVGNPPFIGGKDLRERLGGDYAETLWRANPRVPKSADFVMHWWDRAADILTRPDTRLRRFGFVTTNSITQVFSRRVIEKWLAPSVPSPRRGEGGAAQAAEGEGSATSVAVGSLSVADATDPSPYPLPTGERALGLHLVLAIADHPWTKVGKDAAAVRIAMTVAEAGPGAGTLVTITGERALHTDAPELDEAKAAGVVNADLSVGTDVVGALPLMANEGICHDGVKLHGRGFAIQRFIAAALGIDRRADLEKYIRPYRNGKDLSQRNPADVEDKLVIDFYGISETEVRTRFPEAWQHLDQTVRLARLAQFEKSPTNDARSYLRTWWQFGKPRPELRPALANLNRYIVTVDTARHRVFQFIGTEVVCDDKLVIVADQEDYTLGVLSSAIHLKWTLRVGGWLGVGNDSVYVKSKVFDPFPFPEPAPEQRAAIAEFGEELNATRKAALVENPALTMTGLYNLVEAVRGGGLTAAQEATAVKARARIVAKLHDDLDAAVAAAYGWPADLAPAQIVANLVALNAERAAEEAAGHVRWLRPDYQVPRFARPASA